MSRGVQYNRTPCPARVFEDLGNGFAMGCFGGSLLYFIKGNKTTLFQLIILQERGMHQKEKEFFQDSVMLETELHSQVVILVFGEVYFPQWTAY